MKGETEAMCQEKEAKPDGQSITTESGAAACSNTESSNSFGYGHYVYTESNEAENNRILVYKIGWNGSLHYEGATASGGAGTGAGLGSQVELLLPNNHNWLFSVNAGSHSVSSFKVHNDDSRTLAHHERSW